MKELRVALIDDSLLIQDYIKRALLKIEGCNLVGIASNGVEGLLVIRLLDPDVVLLDMSMPLKNGFETLQELRKENSKVIVIMFTGDETPGLEQKCLAAGANYFVNKTEFQDMVDILVQLQTK